MLTTLDPYDRLVTRLGEASVKKHFDAYEDVAWDQPDHRIAHDDPRFELGDDEPLGATKWYCAQPAEVRARIGLHLAASRLRVGIDFENVLSRGLLEMAATLPCGSPELRYAYHEVIEEGQHSLMFQELVHRIGLPVDGLTGLPKFGSRAVPALGRTFPELFFVHVLAGEAPIDHVQRMTLARHRARPLHPLLHRVMQIHVTEEARHICFAEHYLKRNVPRLSPLRRARLAIVTPFVLRATILPMLSVPGDVARTHAIPTSVVKEVRRGPLLAGLLDRGLAPLHTLFAELGILDATTLPLYRLLGVAPMRALPWGTLGPDAALGPPPGR